MTTAHQTYWEGGEKKCSKKYVAEIIPIKLEFLSGKSSTIWTGDEQGLENSCFRESSKWMCEPFLP